MIRLCGENCWQGIFDASRYFVLLFPSFLADAMCNDNAGSAVAFPVDASRERAYAMALSGANGTFVCRAGIGKSEVMRRMITAARAKWGAEHVAVGALAGSAAFLIEGQTLHSLFGIDTRPLSSQAWLKETLGRPHVVSRLNAARVLFVDVVCTISSSLFMRMAFAIRRVAPSVLQHRPFVGCSVVGTSGSALRPSCKLYLSHSGRLSLCSLWTSTCFRPLTLLSDLFTSLSVRDCQLVASGDPLQVTPIKVTDTSMDRFVFDCSSWRATLGRSVGSVVCLTGSHRQACDADFQSALDRVRWGRAVVATS